MMTYTRKDYEAVPSNQEVHVVMFQNTPGSNEYFVRLWVDYSTHDHLITFGPMSADDVDKLLLILRDTYCEIWENWDGPYESDKGEKNNEEEEAFPLVAKKKVSRDMDRSILDIEYWDCDDGTVGAHFEAVPDGYIFANDEETLVTGIYWLCTEVQKAEKLAEETGSPKRAMDIGMQTCWIEDRLTLRFLSFPGFGVSFTAQEHLIAWLKHLVTIIGTPKTTRTHD